MGAAGGAAASVADDRPGDGGDAPRLVVGLGCVRGASLAALDELLSRTLDAHDLRRGVVVTVSTIETKAAEPGLIELAQRLGLRLTTHPAERLATERVPSASAAVAARVGTPSVAEAAVLACGACLVVPKQKGAGVTLAVGVLGHAQPSRPRG